MGFEEFLPKEVNFSSDSDGLSLSSLDKSNEKLINSGDNLGNNAKISQNQFYGIITSKKPDWQTIIYELVSSEQLDPWDINIILLTKKYFEKLSELEGQEDAELDFYASSKVLLAASLLLRIKSEFLLNKHIQSIDEILFGRKDEEKKQIEKIEIDEDELPILIPKTPMSRMRRVTLSELMTALNKAINTESRRIKKEVQIKRAHKLAQVDIPSFRRIDLKDRIKQFYARILTNLKKKNADLEDIPDKNLKNLNKIGYGELVGNEKEEKLACFLPVLHLSNNQKLWLEQENHLDEIYIYLYEYFDKNRDSFIEELEQDIEEIKQELEQGESFEYSELSLLEKARLKRKQAKEMAEEVAKEIKEELGIINKEKISDKLTGFDDSIL